MTIEELSGQLKRLEEKLEGNEKTFWDKCQVLGTVLGGVLVPLVLALIGFRFSTIITEQQTRSNEAIATNNFRLGQFQLTASLMKSLSSTDALERKQAINFVFIALPEDIAHKLTDSLSVNDIDAGVRASATNVLEMKLSELTRAAVGADPEKSQYAVDQLTNTWRTDPKVAKSIIAAIGPKESSAHSISNAVNVLNSLEASQLRPHSNEVTRIIARGPANARMFQQMASDLNSKLQPKE